MKFHHIAATLLLAVCASSHAQLTAAVAVEPTSRVDSLVLHRASMETSLGKALAQPINVTTTEDLADVMRATRSSGFDVFIGPAQVAASALMRGYELVGATQEAEQYVLVSRPQLATLAAVKGARLYLPQQDSIYTYMARGMLNAGGLSFKDLKAVEHARYPQAGLAAIILGSTDATVVRRADWDEWSKQYPKAAQVIATSAPVPGGLSVVVRSSLPAAQRQAIARWFSGASTSVGLKPATVHAELSTYKTVAQLGLFTPTQLPGATLVTAAEARDLAARGALLVDTRNDKEYGAKHIANAILVPYHEKSLKDVAFDTKADDFSGLKALDKNRPTVFACNGPECWKSYKASRQAIAAGFKQVYWLRGGLPEWDGAGLPVESKPQDANVATLAAPRQP
jgi:rhodanese-related sulfurtransferase